MRVIAGHLKGRRLLSPDDRSIRPTSDRVREALFSILQEHVPGSHFVDLFAGTGAIGIEALSRGAARATFVESDPGSLRLLRENLSRLGLLPVSEIAASTAERWLARLRAREERLAVAFADPPYDRTLALLPSLGHGAIIGPGTIVVVEHATRTTVPPRVGRLVLHRQYRYGDTSLSMFTPASDQVAS